MASSEGFNHQKNGRFPDKLRIPQDNDYDTSLGLSARRPQVPLEFVALAILLTSQGVGDPMERSDASPDEYSKYCS